MSVHSRWLFILIGNDKTGKTTVQRNLVELLSGSVPTRLHAGVHDLAHESVSKKFLKFFAANRSYQEIRRREGYRTVADYFEDQIIPHFDDVYLYFISSHLVPADIRSMIAEGHKTFLNVCALLLTNSINASWNANSGVSAFDWDERWVVENPTSRDNGQTQLREAAESIVQMLIQRTRGW